MTNNSRKEHWIENDLLSSVSVLSQMRWELSKGKEIVNFPAHSITVRLWLVKLEVYFLEDCSRVWQIRKMHFLHIHRVFSDIYKQV